MNCSRWSITATALAATLRGNTSGQDGLSNLGLPEAAESFSFDTVQTWGVTAAYRRFWTPNLRSNFADLYARQDFPDYAAHFTPGSFSATSLNREMQQVIVNLIWSPFGKVNDESSAADGSISVSSTFIRNAKCSAARRRRQRRAIAMAPPTACSSAASCGSNVI